MPKSEGSTGKIRSENLFPVIGVGASAGGLDAFKKFVKAIPEQSGMAFILVQHLDPAHDSILAELLQKVTAIPVLEITDNVHVEPDHIYIIPSNKLLTATDGVLQLADRPPKNYRNMPIDLFFSSLAEVHQDHAIGIVLSGTADDGTLGLKAIKEHGGLTFVQRPDSAAFDGMPKSAVDAGLADFILLPEEMPQQLSNLKLYGHDNGEDPENKFRQVLALLRDRCGVDFTHYKQATIRRRIDRRIAISLKGDLASYLDYLKGNSAEQDLLYQDLLIPVTGFFRDPKIFSLLKETVLSVLLKDRQKNEPVRIWVAGCSTGEEAYSIIIAIHELMEAVAVPYNIQLFATDISDRAILKARAGIYSKNELAGLSNEQVDRFFSASDEDFKINAQIRDACVFAHHDYLNNPPFARIDLVSCRNSLIYMEPLLQKKALATFHYSLKEKGFLLLGKSETNSQAADLFSALDKTSKIYKRRSVPARLVYPVHNQTAGKSKGKNQNLIGNENIKDDFQKNADEVLLVQFAPPGVIVNNDLDIVQFRGATGKWLEQPSGKPSLNVLKMAREGMAFELRNALHKVKKTGESLVKEGIPIRSMGEEYLVTIEVIPLLRTVEPYFLVLFKEEQLSLPIVQGETEKQSDHIKKGPWTRERLRIGELQRELSQTRKDMRGITEDQEASNEELQSANEELLSGSEELQSLNEELETSKEEIQTSNEELIVVNQELYDRNEQLNISRLYAESIVATIREPIIILDKDLRVKSANRSFYDSFQTTQEAIKGRPLFEIDGGRWDVPHLREMLEKISAEKTNITDFEVAHYFPALGMRTLLLNASQILRDNNEEQSILLAIEDITKRRKIDGELKMFSEKLEREVVERTFSLLQANNALGKSNENLGQYAHIASHDLQEPLRKIRIFITLLMERHTKGLPEASLELLKKIDASAERMSTLIRDVLNFSMVSNVDRQFEEVDLNIVIKEVLVDLGLLIIEKQAVVEYGKLPIIQAIRFQMNQLFNNIIGNALKFLRPGIVPLISVTTAILDATELALYPLLDPKSTYLAIDFKDNGIGFEQEYAEQIFLIFNRLHGIKSFPGTGIGLALCKNIVANHNGIITATSQKDGGALFRVILPLDKKSLTSIK